MKHMKKMQNMKPLQSMKTMQEKITNLLTEHSIDACIISHADSITYLTGFKGLVPTEREAYALVTRNEIVLIIPKMYELSARSSCVDGIDIECASERNMMLHIFKKYLKDLQKIGCEAESLTVAEHEKISNELGGTLIGLHNAFSQLRIIKSAFEIEKIRSAQQLTYSALDSVLPELKVGISEIEVRMKLDAQMMGLGAEGPSFDSIVAFGNSGAQPHYKTGAKKLAVGDVVLIDCGALVDGYCGDTTRVFFTAPPTAQQLRIYQLVHMAQKKAITQIKAGMTGEAAYAITADVFRDENELEHYLHGLGHGIGVAVHEAPSLRHGVKDILEEGMVFSIEPGLYYPEWGGVRIEDLVVCKRKSVEILGEYPSDIRIVDIR